MHHHAESSWSLIERVPARTVVNFAVVRHGGTGRFDLAVEHPDRDTYTVASGLSRGQAERAARWINQVLGLWADAGHLPGPSGRLPDGTPVSVALPVDTREPTCVERWPGCESGAYDPRCCRFPKSCSCES